LHLRAHGLDQCFGPLLDFCQLSLVLGFGLLNRLGGLLLGGSRDAGGDVLRLTQAAVVTQRAVDDRLEARLIRQREQVARQPPNGHLVGVRQGDTLVGSTGGGHGRGRGGNGRPGLSRRGAPGGCGFVDRRWRGAIEDRDSGVQGDGGVPD
jgi:hypothetical protein